MIDKTSDEYKIECYKQALQSIIDIGFDYDGSKTIEQFQDLVDELIKIAREGLQLKLAQYIGPNKKVSSIYKTNWINIPEEEWNEDIKNWIKLQKEIKEIRDNK